MNRSIVIAALLLAGCGERESEFGPKGLSAIEYAARECREMGDAWKKPPVLTLTPRGNGFDWTCAPGKSERTVILTVDPGTFVGGMFYIQTGSQIDIEYLDWQPPIVREPPTKTEEPNP